jgi:hypothetical protein
VARGEVADVERDPGEPLDLRRLPLVEEPLGDAALVEHLDRAGVETPGARSVDLRSGSPLDDDDVDPGQSELARQHQPGGAASRDDHGMLRCSHASPR